MNIFSVIPELLHHFPSSNSKVKRVLERKPKPIYWAFGLKLSEFEDDKKVEAASYPTPEEALERVLEWANNESEDLPGTIICYLYRLKPLSIDNYVERAHGKGWVFVITNENIAEVFPVRVRNWGTGNPEVIDWPEGNPLD